MKTKQKNGLDPLCAQKPTLDSYLEQAITDMYNILIFLHLSGV